tara:strand:- start:64 stop:858 length:795 start_codon:yes stop_codon:yes gene_type:complete
MSRARDTADQINRVNSSAADATAITVDSSENVGIGVVPKTWNVYDQALQIGDGAAIWTYQNAEAHYSVNSYYNSGNKYIGTGTALQYQQAGGSHSFKTATSGTADAAISWNSKVDIDSDGLKFNGDTAAANALDDYEEGTWTPTLTMGAGTLTYTMRLGWYRKVGSLVFIAVDVVASCSSQAFLQDLSSLPFTVGSNSGFYPGPAVSNAYSVNLGTGGTALGGYWKNGEAALRFHSYGNNTGQLSPLVSSGTSFEIRMQGFYST